MSKMGLHGSFGHLKHKLWLKEGPGVKLPGIDPIYFAADNVRHTVGKISMRATTLLQPHLNQRFSRKVMGLQSRGSPRWRDFKTLAWESRERKKSHLDVGPVEKFRVYYKGEGGGFPQVWAVVSLVCPCCLWFVLAPKVL